MSKNSTGGLSTTMSSVPATPSLTDNSEAGFNRHPVDSLSKPREAGNGDLPLVFSRKIPGTPATLSTPVGTGTHQDTRKGK